MVKRIEISRKDGGIPLIREQEMRGAIPDVPVYEDIDIDMLTQNDADPMFITLAILCVGEVSANGILYDEALVEAIESKLKGEGGIRGHLGFFTASDYPYREVWWVGHLRDASGITWAKGYIPPGKNKEEIRMLKATQGKLGTSIYGYAEDVEDVEVEGGADALRLIDFTLVSLDLVHHEEASLKMGQWSGFHITAESVKRRVGVADSADVEDTQPDIQEEADMPTKPVTETNEPPVEQPEDNRSAILELKREHQQVVSELEDKLASVEAKLNRVLSAIGETDNPVESVREMQQTVITLRTENGELLKEAIAAQVAQAVKLESARPIITVLVEKENPTNRAEVSEAVTRVLEQDYTKTLLKQQVAETMGPRQTRPVTPVSGSDEDSAYAEHRLQIPEVF